MTAPTRSASFGSVCTELTTSTSGMRCAGMKKCRPIIRPCVFRSLPMTLIGKLEEFEVRAQSGRASCSISANSFCFSARSSVTVSTAMSMVDQSASGRVANVRNPAVSVGLPMAGQRLGARRRQAVAGRGRARDDIDLPAAGQEHGDDADAHGSSAQHQGVLRRRVFALRHFSPSQTRRTAPARGKIAAHL